VPSNTGGTKSAPAVAQSAGVGDILVAFSADIANEQVAYTDELDESVFAQAELSGFESENYDY
jgi:ABC-type sulfate transport system substrate-binding protein